MNEANPQHILEVRGLKRHFGNVAALDGIDLNVNAGEIYGFLGVNGAGKTTTIRVLMGIIAAESGSIRMMGESTRRTSVRQKQSIGYVSQEQNFYPWMSCRMLGRFVGSFYRKWDKAEFARLLELFEIPDTRKVSQLSGGMKAKLALALAIAPKPDLLILDEPTAGLDPVARREFMELIVAQARHDHRTTFFSSHLIDEVERCADKIGIIHAGRVRFEGSLGVLKSEVRSILFHGTPEVLPSTFELWSERKRGDAKLQTFRADAQEWDALQLSDSCEIHSLSLEDIFIACVGVRRVFS